MRTVTNKLKLTKFHSINTHMIYKYLEHVGLFTNNELFNLYKTQLLLYLKYRSAAIYSACNAFVERLDTFQTEFIRKRCISEKRICFISIWRLYHADETSQCNGWSIHVYWKNNLSISVCFTVSWNTTAKHRKRATTNPIQCGILKTRVFFFKT